MSEKTASMKDELCVGTVSSKGLTDVLHRHREADERGKDERNCYIKSSLKIKRLILSFAQNIYVEF